MIVMKSCVKRMLCAVFVVFSTGYALASDDFPEIFINEVSEKSINILCGDRGFLDRSKIGATGDCIETLSAYRKKCSKLIKPLIPDEISGKYEDRDKEIKKISSLKYLGELYYMCLIAVTFQNN